MSENFEQMLDDYSKTIRNGEVVEGTVIDVKPDEIILNIGYKADGISTKNAYTNDASVDLTEVVSPGDTLEAKVLKVNDGDGQVLLSHKRLAQEKVSERLKEAYENEEVLKATVTQVLDGGLSVIIDDTRIFIPASLVSDVYERDLTKYQDQEIEFVLTEFNPHRRRIIGNRKMLLLAEREQRQKELLERIQVGDVIEGKVKNITDFGAFIDLGGADGLLHISEMSWGRVDNPRKIYKVGDTVRVFIKDIRDTKVALSVKFPEENPWNNAADKYAPGTIITGKVARMTDFGAFVELAPGVDALLHVSQIAREHVDKPSDVLSIGQEIEAKIVDFNAEEHKISLSMKALAPLTPKQEEIHEEVQEAASEVAADEINEEAAEVASDVAAAEAAMTAGAVSGAADEIAAEADEAAAAVEAIEEELEEEAASEAAEEIISEADEVAEEVDAAEEELEDTVAEEVAAAEDELEAEVAEEVAAGELTPEEAEVVIEETEAEMEEEAIEAVEEIEASMEEAAAEAVTEDAEDIIAEKQAEVDAIEEVLEETVSDAVAEDAAEIAEETMDTLEASEDVLEDAAAEAVAEDAAQIVEETDEAADAVEDDLMEAAEDTEENTEE